MRKIVLFAVIDTERVKEKEQFSTATLVRDIQDCIRLNVFADITL